MRGTGDPAHRFVAGRFWWACATPDGDGTLALSARGTAVSAQAWGDGADWLLAQVPALLGAGDDWSGLDLQLAPGAGAGAATRVRACGCARPGGCMDSLVPAVLEQKVTGREARRAWRTLLHWHGRAAPGPTPGRCASRPTRRPCATSPPGTGTGWASTATARRRSGRPRPIAARLEQSTAEDVLTRLRLVPGVGEWTAAETAQRAFGHPDAVSVGDYHIKNWVTFALTGRPRGTDEQMVALLAPVGRPAPAGGAADRTQRPGRTAVRAAIRA